MQLMGKHISLNPKVARSWIPLIHVALTARLHDLMPTPVLLVAWTLTGSKIIEENPRKTLGEDVGNLKAGRHVKDTNQAFLNVFPDEVNVELDVLGSSRRRFRSQHISATTLATPRYSASALEREMVDCLLEDHEIRLSPR
ncbi:hypothetical protein L6452_21807 [Arctium lappa]|uniref:Uncharacterized protein n=1 Tax=Arctium lappa TaxID=4217 RepID=A0ACB9AX77_ARCLA|nr:hypothetical protein L6452_21807 [Arctium lappa]